MFSQRASKTIVSLLLYYFLSGSYDLVHADVPCEFCPDNPNSHNALFKHNLNNLLVWLSSNASASKFYKTSAGDNGSDHRVYGLYMCYGYNRKERCQTCIKAASENIQKECSNSTEAVRWEEACQLRYSKQEFFGKLDVVGNMEQQNNVKISSEPERFKSAVTSLLSNLAEEAARDQSLNKYAVKETDYAGRKLYALTQCTGDLSRDSCRKCLEVAIANASSCCSSSMGARVLSKSCYLRYELYNFYGEMPGKGSKWNIRKAIIFVVPTFVAILLLGSFVYYLKMRIGSAKKEQNDQELPLHSMGDPNGVDFLKHYFQATGDQKAADLPYIDLATINEATNNFAESNMLGQGGFGPVYKGTLSDGKEIAVKRLSSCSQQGSEEFTNEVLLIMKLQHKNLVRLLGFCINGEEKLLVYEYMPNGSLDVTLLDPTKRAQLDWRSRFNIISGIARGMLYLHEDSRLRIIHRDLKASNVLLDSNMNPKISDFGMARIFVGSEGEASTCRLVGTYGYMAPEYAMEGHYSVKSDVFSFGVLLLEIITGKKNAGFQKSKHAPSLIAHAWQLWNEGKALELMDPLLTDSCAPDNFLKCVYLGLLCVQEDAQERPTMSSVVVTLNSESETLRQPERPAFSWGTSNDYDEINVDSLSINNINISSVSYQLERD